MRSHARTALRLAALLAAAAAWSRAAVAAPDLTTTAVDASAVLWSEPGHAASGTVFATVRNIGTSAAGAGIVRFFEDRDGNEAFNAGTDLDLGSAAQGPLAAGDSAVVAVGLSAQIAFRDRPIYATADATSAVTESDESNNTRSSAFACAFARPTGAMDAELEWTWAMDPGDPYPAHRNVPMTPVVADLDGDGVPEVLFGATASTAGSLLLPGVLRSIRGDAGTPHFTVTDPGLSINTTSGLAVGDLDMDGYPEIVAAAADGVHLICFEHDGAFKWTSSTLEASIGWGAPEIADLDEVGAPEIVVGRQVLNADGTLRWTGTKGKGATSTGPLSFVADANLDGSPDVIAGNTIYNYDGSIQADATATVTDGTVAVANLDADPYPEFVHVTLNTVRVLDHMLATVGVPVMFPVSTSAPPTIADYDGDGAAEIAIAGSTQLVVYEPNLSLRWSAAISDLSSSRTPSAAFDFDADGAAEIVFRDEQTLRIFRGTDGAVLQSIPMNSCTFYDHPVVADVDADGDAEIVVGAGTNCSSGLLDGMQAFRSADDRWYATRRIWNQFAYVITNVNDDGSIPGSAFTNWLHPSLDPYNNFRQSELVGAPARGIADLTASRLELTCGDSDYTLRVRVGNGGSVIARRGIPVRFYDGDPGGSGVLLAAAQTTKVLVPGDFEDVPAVVPGYYVAAGALHAVADDAGGLIGTEPECDETNNIVFRAIDCISLGVSDTLGADLEMEPIRPNPFAGQTDVAFSLRSPGEVRLEVFDIRGRRVRTLLSATLPAGRHTKAWDGVDSRGTPVTPGVYLVRLFVDGREAVRKLIRL